jgi:hypothetical protein
MATSIRLDKITPNPNNPRIINDHRLDKLCDNIRKYPKLLEVRPIVVESRRNPVILGGNMRHRALLEIGYTTIPESWVKYADELTPEERQAFIILDNVGFGEWDMEALANEWSSEQLSDWGVDLPRLDIEPEEHDKPEDNTVREPKKTYKLEVYFAGEDDLSSVHTYLVGKGYRCKIINS